MKLDINIVNARIMLETGLYEGSISVSDGKIVKICKDSSLPKTESVVDVGGKLVIPGLVDLHVHFREPGFTHKEDFLTGTKAAVAGGVTTVVDEPNNNPVTSSAEALQSKHALVKGKAYVDYLINMAVYSNQLGEIRKASQIGVGYFAFFDELGDIPTGFNNTGVLRKALRTVKQLDGLALLNCRESYIVIYTMNKLKKQGKNSLNDYMNHFPHIAESIGAAKRILIAHETGVRAHLREVSTAETIEVIRNMKPYMKRISTEVRPDHLFLSRENTENLGPYAQQWTPLRTKTDQTALWEALSDGTVNVIASDHATHTFTEKEKGWDNIWDSPPGLPAIESMLPLLLTAVNDGRLELDRLVKVACANPAKVIHQYPKKGCIAVGSDADLVVLDIKKEKMITGDESLAKTHWTPYEGWKVKGIPVATFIRGVQTFADGEILVEPGHGTFLSA